MRAPTEIGSTQILDAAGWPEQNAVCRHCGYSLWKLPGFRCPECGKEFDPRNPATFRIRHDQSLPERLIGDRAYDSDGLDEELRSQGIEMIAPHRSNRVRSLTQDRRRLRRYTRRWLVERFFDWIQWRRRLLVRWEFYPQNFLGFVQLACLLILFRQF